MIGFLATVLVAAVPMLAQLSGNGSRAWPREAMPYDV
jgi:hypothetical protein